MADQTGGAGDDALYGTDKTDTLDGAGGNDALYGLGGDDVLIGGGVSPGGTNQLWGGSGSDTAAYWKTTGTVYADLATQAGYVDGVLTDQMNSIENLAGGSGTNTLVGDGGANVLTGGASTDYLYGQGGDDTLIGGSATFGANQLWGGAGDDTASYVGTMGSVYADLGAQAGYVNGILTDQMNSIENLTGGLSTNTLVGDGGTNVLTGGRGTDFLYGQDGDDTLIGGPVASGGPNQLWGGAGSDTASYAGATGTVYADLGAQSGYVDGLLVDQMNSIENLTGGSGTNTLVGDSGGNVLTGGAGTDYLYGQDGDDILIGGAAAPANPNQLWGGSGNDTASYAGTIGNVSASLRQQQGFVGGQFVDQMNSIENLVGGSGNDSLTGDAASNVLTGGAGADVLDGGGGGDRFVYLGYADSNTVTGVDAVAFVSGGDKLDFTALHTDASHIAISSAVGQTSLAVEQTPGTFNAATDLLIGFGSSTVTTADILF